MNIIGISAYYHDSAACLVSDGKLIAAAQEERFNRIKNSPVFPLQAINYCIHQAELSFSDIDYIAYYEKPYIKFQRIIQDYVEKFPRSYFSFLRNIPYWLQDRLIIPIMLKKELGYTGPSVFVPHHYSHASSSFYLSPFDKAGIITADGVGEFATTCYGHGNDTQITLDKQLNYPHSIGLLYTALTTYLGFKANSGEGTTMALASFGEPSFKKEFSEFIHIADDGSFMINKRYFPVNISKRMYSGHLIKLLGTPRKPEEKITARHKNIAATLQYTVEEALVKMARHTVKRTGHKDLCLAGGVFLNCVANQKILDLPEVNRVFIQPGAGDAGAAIGAAFFVWHQLLNKPRSFEMNHAYWGPEYSSKNIKAALSKHQLPINEYAESSLLDIVTDRIISGKVVGWMQKRMEFGPRALGNRSILADPRKTEMVDVLNTKIKHREWFRPFAPIVKKEDMYMYVKSKTLSPFMLLAPELIEEKKQIIPAACHVDGTARVQSVDKAHNLLLWNLLDVFERKTGIPVLINTSFNLRGEPIVNTPEEAIKDYLNSEMDVLVLGNYVVEKTNDK